MLAHERGQFKTDHGPEDFVLHFAAEPVLEKIFRKTWSNYKTADLFFPADLKLNLEEIDLEDESTALIIANHVLEHVDDRKTAREFHRILKPGGTLACMVPIIEGWEKTYENPEVSSEEDRWLHFGQGDHVRYFGRDFRDRIASGGLTLTTEFTAEGNDVIKYGLCRGEKVFIFQKQ